MWRWSDVLSTLLLSSLWGRCCASEHDGCKDYGLQFERVFSVPGDVAMLKSTLLSPPVFNLSAERYNVTWYRLPLEQPIINRRGRVLVMGEALWFLNVSQADTGVYVTVVRTRGQCFRQETELVVDPPPSQCGRPRTSGQQLTKGVNDLLSCPLKDYTSKLHSYGTSYNITWYKGCEQISDGADRFHYWNTFLKVKGVETTDQGLYTCTLHFSLGGVRGGVSETIDTEVKGDFCLLPQIREPAKDVVRAALGSNVTKRCLVFVPCEGHPLLDVDVYWLKQHNYIPQDPNKRVYTTEERVEWQDGGAVIDRWLVISELKEEDLNLNYSCKAWSSRKSHDCYFTLLHKEPELLIPVSLLLGSCLLLFLLCVSVHHVFKLDLVLCFRRTFPTLYSNSGSDGKLYDAYVAYPQRCSMDWSQEVEKFALLTMPQVLEEACGYSLFIPARDSLPGEAVMDSVERNLNASRRIILLYTASTFNKEHCSNNNTLLSRPTDQAETGHHSQISKEHLNTNEEHLNINKEYLNTNKEHLNINKEHLNSSEEHLNTNKEHLNTNKEHLNTNKEHLNTNEEHLNINKEHLNTNEEHLNINKEHLNSSEEHLNSSEEHLNSNKEHLNTNEEHLNTNKEHLNTNKEHLNSNKEHLNTNEEHLNTNKEHLNTNKEHLNTNKEHLNSRKVHFSPSEDPCDCPGRCEGMCGHASTQLECVAGMHRALLERSLKVILVELEELGPSQVEQLPESVRHLRRSQGVVCWWKTRGRGGSIWRTGDTETALSSCLSPDCRFWKEVRYKMPVKGTRTSPREETALLQLNRTQRHNAIPV